jgi:hypothetical protein
MWNQADASDPKKASDVARLRPMPAKDGGRSDVAQSDVAQVSQHGSQPVVITADNQPQGAASNAVGEGSKP